LGLFKDLKLGISTLNEYWSKLSAYPIFRKLLPAWVRCFEITYNPVLKSWHPHIHCIAYANGYVLDYLKAQDAKLLKHMGLTYSSLNVKTLSQKKLPLSSVIRYTAAYLTKPQFPTEFIVYANSCVRRLRMISFGGYFVKPQFCVKSPGIMCSKCGKSPYKQTGRPIRSFIIPDLRFHSPPILRETFFFLDDRTFEQLSKTFEWFHSNLDSRKELFDRLLDNPNYGKSKRKAA